MPTTRTLSATFIEPGPDAGDRLRIQATTESGFDLGFDTLSASEGGIGPGPTEAILASLAACTAMDVASILRKKRQRVESYGSQVTGSEGRGAPAGVHRHQRRSTRWPEMRRSEALRRSIELSATRLLPGERACCRGRCPSTTGTASSASGA